MEQEGGWDALIDRMEEGELEDMIRNGGYQTLGSVNVGKPRAIDFDGPSGLNEGGVTHEPYSITYPCAANLAVSWDRENSRLHGYSVGEDALAADGNWGSHEYTGIISGWYAPAMNIHRTPFAGRNFEYYSEDGFLSGQFALEAANACAKKGVYAYIKHFALNDQEDYRSQAVKHILYTTANSNAMNGIVHGVATSELPFANYYYILIGEGIIAAVVIVLGILAIVRRWKAENKSIPIFKK